MNSIVYQLFGSRLFLCLLASVFGASVSAQTLASRTSLQQETSQPEKNTKISLVDALEEIKGKYKISLLFERRNVENKLVDRVLFQSDLSAEEVLSKLLQPTGLYHQKIDDKTFVVLMQKDKTIERKKLNYKTGSSDSSLLLGKVFSSLPAIAILHPLEISAISVSGRVTGENNDPLPGVNVVVKGTQNGTITDAQGQYRLNVEDENTVLVFSFIGYISQEITVGNRSAIDVQLVSDIKSLAEVVVVGYGTQQKRDVTGAIATVKGTEIAQVPVANFDAALQGRAAGLQVSQAGGAPGSAVRVQIRGTSSVSSGTEPLYVVDGMILYQDINGLAGGRTGNNLNPLANINPSDIESIEVLKDAAATAIYGSRGANGVIIVTTKTGQKGRASTTLDYNRGVSNAANLVDYVNGSQWLEMVDAARTNSVDYGITAGQEQFNPLTLVSNNLQAPDYVLKGPQFGPNTTWTRELAEQTNTNWRDYMLRQGDVQELNLSTSNGFEKGGFFISGQYRDEEGIMIGNRLQRYSARANIDFAPTNKIRAGAKVSFSYLNFSAAQLGIGGNGGNIGRQNFGATGGWGQVNSGALPIMPVYNDDGSYFDPLRGRNIAAGADPNNYSSRTYQNRTLGNVFLEYTLLPGLSLRGEGSVDFINNNAIYWVSDIIRYNRVGQEEGRFISNRNFNGYATFNRQLGNNHQLSLTAGAETQKTATRRQDYAYEGLQGSQQEIGEIGNGTNQFITAVSGIFGDSYFISYFGRANYKLMDRYLFGLSFRRDGSTAFGPNNRFGNFPAVSLGWIVSNEDFFSPLSSIFSFVKLRASYGRTGNANIRSFAFLNNYVNWPVYGTAPAYGFSVLANPDIGWEVNDQADAALEFGLFNGRLQGSFGYYNKLSKDMLLNVPVAPNVGIGAGGSVIITNIGDLRNSGVELELNSVNFERGGFRWSTALNFTTNHNKIIRLTPQFDILPSGSNPVATGIQQGVSITQVGGRLGTYYLAEYAGLDNEGFETIYEIDKNVLRENGETVKTGNIIRATQANINANRIVQDDKSGLPTWFGGLTNTFSFKGIELSALFTFQGGNYIYDALEENNSYVRTGSNVIRAEVYGNTWTEANPNAKYPKLTWNMRDTYDDPATEGRTDPQTLGTRTTRFLYKGDYARLKTLQVAYNLPSSLVQKIRLQNIRIYANAQNLLTFTKYPGFDPEVVILSGSTEERNLRQGFISGAPYPQVRTYNAGMSITF